MAPLDEREQFLTILRCAAATSWSWGRHTLVRILRGDDQDRRGRRPLQERAREHPDFGVLACCSRSTVERLLVRLERGGFLEARHIDQGVVLDLTRAGRAALQNPAALDELVGPAESPPPPDRSAQTEAGAPDVDEALFQALRAWRLEQARVQGVSPFVVFHDSHLRAIAAQRPVTLEALSELKGIGPGKLAKYGPMVIELVRQHVEEMHARVA